MWVGVSVADLELRVWVCGFVGWFVFWFWGLYFDDFVGFLEFWGWCAWFLLVRVLGWVFWLILSW